MTGAILSNAELAHERAVLAHVETDVRVIAMERRRAARIAEKAACRANLARLAPVAPTPMHPR